MYLTNLILISCRWKTATPGCQQSQITAGAISKSSPACSNSPTSTAETRLPTPKIPTISWCLTRNGSAKPSSIRSLTYATVFQDPLLPKLSSLLSPLNSSPSQSPSMPFLSTVSYRSLCSLFSVFWQIFSSMERKKSLLCLSEWFLWDAQLQVQESWFVPFTSTLLRKPQRYPKRV